MIKEIDYTLNYRIKGEPGIKKIKIDFVPNRRHTEYNKLQSEILEVKALWSELKMIEEEANLLRSTKPEGYKSAIIEFTKRLKEIEIQIKSYGDFLIRRFELMKDILVDNGYGNDHQLMDFDFWDECVSPSAINELLDLAIWKDIDKKKIM